MQVQISGNSTTFHIEAHKHRFAIWAASRAAFVPPAAGVVLTSDPVGILVAPFNRARSFAQKGTFAAGIGPVGRGAK
jgi:hypothetical protein